LRVTTSIINEEDVMMISG